MNKLTITFSEAFSVDDVSHDDGAAIATASRPVDRVPGAVTGGQSPARETVALIIITLNYAAL